MLPANFRLCLKCRLIPVGKSDDLPACEFGRAEYRGEIKQSRCPVERRGEEAEMGEGLPPLFLNGQEMLPVRSKTRSFRQYTPRDHEQVSSGSYIGKGQRNNPFRAGRRKRPGAGLRAASLRTTAALPPLTGFRAVLFLLKNASAGFLPCGGAFLCGGLYSATNSPSAVSRNCSGAG